MLRLNSTGMRFAVSLMVLSLALSGGWFVVKPWLSQRVLSEQPSTEELLRAISHDPGNPFNHYRLGLYRRYDPAERDLKKAIFSYIAAINLNPTKAQYWLELAGTYEDLGELAASKRALDRALLLKPTNIKSRWMTVNLLLRQGETDRALSELKPIVKDHPRERIKVFSLLHMITGDDVELILKRALPRELKPITAYLLFLIRRGDTVGVKRLWKTLSRDYEVDSKMRIRYINYLISRDDIEEAMGEWTGYKGRGKEPANLVWNGGFEEDIYNGGFGWKTGRVEGVVASIDDKVFRGGRRSLRVEFDGGHNINFHHVYQVVPLEPRTMYTLSADMMTEEITTGSGIFMEFYGINGCKFYKKTETLTDTNDWGRLGVEFTTPQGCNAGAVRLRRLKSEKLDNLIDGRAWVDGVWLEKSYTATKRGIRDTDG